MLSVCSHGFAAESAAPYIKLFEKTYRTSKTLRATFLERYIEQGRVTRAESGVAYFRKPGKMRWEYRAPENKLFLIDGKNAWFYVPADHTVTKVAAKQSDDWRTPLALLAGEAKVSRICSSLIVDPAAQPEDKTLVSLSCQLKQPGGDKDRTPAETLSGDAPSDFVLLTIARASGELRKVQIHDRGGIIVEFAFANWEFDPPVDERNFHFDVPRGVAIVTGDPGASGSATEH